MALETIYGSKKTVRTTSPACVATTMASVVEVKSPVSSSVSSSAPTRKPGSSRRRLWLEQSYATARAKAAPWRTPLRATVLTQAGMAHRRSSHRTPPVFMSLTAMRATSRRAANSSSKADNTKNHQNKAVDIWTELLNERNLTNRPGLSIGSYHPGISILPL